MPVTSISNVLWIQKYKEIRVYNSITTTQYLWRKNEIHCKYYKYNKWVSFVCLKYILLFAYLFDILSDNMHTM